MVCPEGVYQSCLGVSRVPLITVPDTRQLRHHAKQQLNLSASANFAGRHGSFRGHGRLDRGRGTPYRG
jgi:hypothetical protein